MHLSGLDFRSGLDLGITCAGYDPDWLKTYGEYYGGLNCWMDGIVGKAAGTAYGVEDLCPRDTLERSEFYNDWIKPQEDILGGGAAMLFSDASRLFVLGGNVRRRDIDRLEDDWLRLARLLTPHLMNALEVNRQLAGKSLETYALDSGGDRRTAVLAINADRRMLLANTPARALLETGRVVRGDLQGRLSFCGAAERAFQQTLSLFDVTRVFPPRTFEIRAPDCGYLCRLSAIEPDDLDYSPLGVLLGPSETALLITIAPLTGDIDAANRLAAQYSLSPMECRVALKVASGLSARDIADENGTSLNTVRNQLRAAMAKLGVNKQVDLTRVVEQARLFAF